MRARNILRTLAFRIVLIYLVVFALSAAAITAITYWNAGRALDAQTDQANETEVASLSEHYERFGLGGLSDAIANRSIHGGPEIYLLVDTELHPIAGNLDAWPQTSAVGGDLVEFDYERRVGSQSERRQARGRIFALTGGFQLLVARDVFERRETEKFFTTTLPWSVGLVVLLGALGGVLISRNFAARLDSINRTSREIMTGDLSRRLPVGNTGDEFDTLAANLNRMLDRTERLMRGMRDVTDSIAHDLRTPLNRLRNRLEGALHGLTTQGDTAAQLEAAIDESDRLIATFNALLSIAEAEAGVAREAMTKVDLPEIVEGVAELYAPLADDKGISLSVAPSGAATIRGNRSLISQALANLLDNAIKYTPAGGIVKVAVENRPLCVALCVADTGPGIPEDDRGRVLERFVRLEASRHSPGTGLGLSLVAAVARLHDAQLELADNRPGLKATLLFPAGTLPALPPPKSKPSHAA